MKRIIPLILCLLLLAACAEKTEAPADKTRTPQSEKTEAPTPKPTPETENPSPPPSPFVPPYPFTEENYPRVDGSTATIPLIAAVESVMLEKPRSEIAVNVRKTSGAYTALATGEADILLVYDGGDETRLEVNADARFETVPIGRDALIFVVNSDNPIDNLTSEQVRKIFSGEYTNWSEVGGSNIPIRAYQRGIGSGSQALMDKLVMRGLEMANPATVPVIGDMGGLVDAVANYSGGPTAIGYNVYYYVTEMKSNDQIKILSVDGVAPSYETIQSNSYPFVSDFYSVIRKNEPVDSPARALHEWMLSPEAQNLMAAENYVALHADPGAATPNTDGEFSFYPEGEAPEYFEGTNIYALRPSNKYGPLYFYLGSTHVESWSMPEFFGLCTADGKIVTEPVYSAPEILIDSADNHAYLCYRSDLERHTETLVSEDWSYDRLTSPAIMFATDGSWVLEFEEILPFYGFTGVIDTALNSDFLVARRGGKWGAVNLKGEVVIPFNLDDFEGIYTDPNDDGDYSSPYLGVTANRFMRSSEGGFDPGGLFNLYDANENLIAAGLRGMPTRRAGCFILTQTWGDQSAVYTYTLDGELLATLKTETGGISGAVPMGDYVRLYKNGAVVIADRNLNILYEIPLTLDPATGWYNYMASGPNVLYESDSESSLHRTYLPDGTRLVTWYDPDMGDQYSPDNIW